MIRWSWCTAWLVVLSASGCTSASPPTEHASTDSGGPAVRSQIPREPDGGRRADFGLEARREAHRIDRPELRQVVRSTALLVDDDRVVPNASGGFDLKTRRLTTSRDVCPDESFADQPALGFCTGFLVGPRLLATAGHCVRNAPECEATRALFDYQLRPSGSVPTDSSRRDVYECQSVVREKSGPNDADVALIRLDRPVPGRTPLSLRRTPSPNRGESLALVGHPAGIPTKVDPAGRILEVSRPGVIRHDFETVLGDSGSPLVDPATGDVLALHVRGSGGYAATPGRHCRVARACAGTHAKTECVPTEAVLASSFASDVSPTRQPRSFRFRGARYDPGPGAVGAQFAVPDVGPVGSVHLEARVRTDEHTTLEIRMTRTVAGRGGERRTRIEAVDAGIRNVRARFGDLHGRNGEGLWRVELEPYDGASIQLEHATLWMRGAPDD